MGLAAAGPGRFGRLAPQLSQSGRQRPRDEHLNAQDVKSDRLQDLHVAAIVDAHIDKEHFFRRLADH